MLRALLRIMTWRDWAVVAAGLAVVVGIEHARPPAPPAVLAPPPGAAPAVFDQPADLRIDPAFILPPEVAQLLHDTMDGQSYFGAFALGGQGGYGWTVGYGSAQAARATALASCAQHDDGCRVVADLWPQGLTDPPADSLSFVQAESYRQTRAQTGPRAFARALDGAYGSARGLTWQEARSVAIARCNAGREGRPPFLPPTPCEVLAVWDAQGEVPPFAD